MKMELDSVQEQQLQRLNKGYNLFNIGKNGKKYFIKVNLVSTQNLLERDEKIEVETNLPFGSSWNYDFADLEKDLKEFVKKPLAKVRINKKSPLGYWEGRELGDEVREETIKFFDIEIEVGLLAREKLKSMGVDLEKEVKEILEQQKGYDKEIQEKIDNFIKLKEKIAMLKNLIGVSSNNYDYRYNRQKEDKSLKIRFSPEEYNEKLKEVEKEIRVIEKDLGLSETKIPYEEIKEPITYESWFKENEEQLREDFEMRDDEMTFDEYAEMVFHNSEELEDIE